MLVSCQNCWFNGLQYGALGLSVGYCSRHRIILNAADATTCGLHVRKDLSLDRAQQVAAVHAARYASSLIVRIYGNETAKDDVSSNERDLDSLRSDAVGDVVVEYGMLDSKIESLAQLKAMSGARAEVAMLSLARSYVSHCIGRQGSWTSGLHLYWWTKERLTATPDIAITDIRSTGGLQLARQIELTAWSVVMLRLTVIDDIIEYAAAQDDPLGEVRGLLDKSAEAVSTFNLRTLAKWMRTEARPRLDRMLPYERYVELARQLHKDQSDEAPPAMQVVPAPAPLGYV
jgi:hypothetical protein